MYQQERPIAESGSVPPHHPWSLQYALLLPWARYILLGDHDPGSQFCVSREDMVDKYCARFELLVELVEMLVPVFEHISGDRNDFIVRLTAQNTQEIILFSSTVESIDVLLVEVQFEGVEVSITSILGVPTDVKQDLDFLEVPFFNQEIC